MHILIFNLNFNIIFYFFSPLPRGPLANVLTSKRYRNTSAGSVAWEGEGKGEWNLLAYGVDTLSAVLPSPVRLPIVLAVGVVAAVFFGVGEWRSEIGCYRMRDAASPPDDSECCEQMLCERARKRISILLCFVSSETLFFLSCRSRVSRKVRFFCLSFCLFKCLLN